MIRHPLSGMLVYIAQTAALIAALAAATLWMPVTKLWAAEPATSTPTVVPREPETTPTPTPTSIAQPGAAYIAVLIGECVVPVGGTASSDVFVHLQDVHPGIVRMQLVLHFDPQIVRAQDADGQSANGIQVAVAAFFESAQTTIENRADNDSGEIALTLAQAEDRPVQETASWRKVATIVWTGQQAGHSALIVGEESRFASVDGQTYAPTALHHGTAFARLPAQVKGRVLLQGRSEHGNTLIGSSLTATRVDRSYTGADGSFVVTATHGEGYYTLSASAPGYLTAESSGPIKLTVGDEIELAPITLLGGDVNGDNLIDIRDLSYVAYHLGGLDVQSDINGDGEVDILDLTLVSGNFGTAGPIPWPTSD
jgi:hypothetical protein